jgi:L-ribulose-5-phosphate 4-epimerase
MSQEPTEGVIRYRMHWEKGPAPLPEAIAELLIVREKLFRLRLIGWDQKENVGYGNISCRQGEGHSFYISGTQTSGIEEGSPELFTLVTSSDPSLNELYCTGPAAASSEAMTHGMLYITDPSVGAVIHVHHAPMWRALKHKVPTTRESAGYGTPAMAAEIATLFRNGGLASQKILVMAGHEDGLITFGRSPEDAFMTLQHFLAQV